MWCAPASWDGRAGFQNFPSEPHKNQQTGAKATLPPPEEFRRFAENSRGSGAHANVLRGISTGKPSLVHSNVDRTPLFANPVTSRGQCRLLFAEGPLWPPKPTEPTQDKPEVPQGSGSGSSPHPGTGGRRWINTGFLAPQGHVLHWPQSAPAWASGAHSGNGLIKVSPRATAFLSLSHSGCHSLTFWGRLPQTQFISSFCFGGHPT